DNRDEGHESIILAPAAHVRGRVMTVDLNGKAALVTGGSRGIGLAIARSLLEVGARVTITGRDGAHLEAVSTQLAAAHPDRGAAIAADAGNADQAASAVDATVSRFGGLDILINNAAVGHIAPVAEMRLDHWRELVDTNVSGVFYYCRAAIPRLL